MSKWRLILNPPQDGAWNMAVDEAILEFAANHIVPPTLRLYDWQPYTLSLGHAQPVSDVHLEKLQKRKWGLVRRPTGGHAILHADELTYSICAPEDNDIVQGGVLESYRKISRGLLEALEILGIHADSKPKDSSDRGKNTDPVCFHYPSDYEITYQNKKIIGSAQARKKGGVLQHGAIPLLGDITRITSVLSFSNDKNEADESNKLRNRAANLSNILQREVRWDEFAEAMQSGFSKAHHIEWAQDDLSIAETQLARQLYKEKYSNSAWTFRI